MGADCVAARASRGCAWYVSNSFSSVPFLCAIFQMSKFLPRDVRRCAVVPIRLLRNPKSARRTKCRERLATAANRGRKQTGDASKPGMGQECLALRASRECAWYVSSSFSSVASLCAIFQMSKFLLRDVRRSAFVPIRLLRNPKSARPMKCRERSATAAK